MFTGVALRACKCGIQCRATIAEEMGVEKKIQRAREEESEKL